jgi:transcriptional regulator with XRE-family HTH domain
VTIGERLKSLRLGFGLTQEELGRRSGLAPVSIGYFEGGRADPSVHVLDQICRGLGVSLALFSTTPVVNGYRPARTSYRR